MHVTYHTFSDGQNDLVCSLLWQRTDLCQLTQCQLLPLRRLLHVQRNLFENAQLLRKQRRWVELGDSHFSDRAVTNKVAKVEVMTSKCEDCGMGPFGSLSIKVLI